jgi:hypothetical protein
MRISRWIWLVVVLVAGTLLWVGIHSLRRPRTPTPITDLGATMPLNQPGGGVVPTEAYAVYSAMGAEVFHPAGLPAAPAQ